MSNKFGKIELNEFDDEFNSELICYQRERGCNKNYKKFNEYLEKKDAYLIHKFINPICFTSNGIEYKAEYIIDNYGNIYNLIHIPRYHITGYKFYVEPAPKYMGFPDYYQYLIDTYEKMHPYAIYENKLSNKSIKLIKCIDLCSEESMLTLIKYLIEDKEEDIHFMKNKIKELEDINKDLLLKMDEMKEKHNDLINKLMDRIADLTPKN